MLVKRSPDGQKTTWVIFGIVSGGIPEFCGSREHPTRFVRLDDEEIVNFIQSKIEDILLPANTLASNHIIITAIRLVT